jgi:thioredoxin-dependent peroxiredoxin
MKSRTMFTLLMAATLFFVNHAALAAGPKIGEAAPDFSLPDQNGQTHKLSDFRGKWLVLYFYVKDDTPGCTEQACKFRDDIHQLGELGAQVVGVSVDNTASHADFAKKYSLPFPLLSDNKGEIASRYDSLRGDGSMAKRNTFMIDPQGRIAKIYLSASTSRNSAEVIEDLKKLKSGQRRDS